MITLNVEESGLFRQVPVIKLKAEKLEPCIRAQVSAESELRKDVVANIIRDVFPQTDEKHSFRALVAPALTRLHFAISSPPFFRKAPNARLWRLLPEDLRSFFISICVFDFARVRLGLKCAIIPPEGSLRKEAQPHGPKLVDQVRGFDLILEFYSEQLRLYPGKNVGDSHQFDANIEGLVELLAEITSSRSRTSNRRGEVHDYGIR